MKGRYFIAYGYVPITGHAHDAGMYVKQHDQSKSTSMNSVEIFGQIQNVRIYIWILYVIG
jgi:hypothetical protein